MAILCYFDVFPEKTKTELRTATIVDGSPNDTLPIGTYIFTEYYCTDPDCNCQRVLVKVFHARSESARPEEVATISYSWNPKSDEIWEIVHGDMPNPFLDPFHRQAEYAPVLLNLWNSMIEYDKAYALRLRRHYDEIRSEHGWAKGEQVLKRPAKRRTCKTPARSDAKRRRKP